MQHQAAGEDDDIRAFAESDGLADGQIGAFVIDLRVVLAAEADVFHAGTVNALAEHAVEAGGVGNVDDGRAGQGAVKSHVFKRHVGAAVHRGGNARVGAEDGDVVFRVAGGQESLVEAAAGREDAETVADGLEACGGKSCGDTDHIGFGYAALDGAGIRFRVL